MKKAFFLGTLVGFFNGLLVWFRERVAEEHREQQDVDQPLPGKPPDGTGY